jgi:hypothetical protein
MLFWQPGPSASSVRHRKGCIPMWRPVRALSGELLNILY